MRIWILAIILVGCMAPESPEGSPETTPEDAGPTDTATPGSGEQGTSGQATAPATGEITYKQDGDRWIAMRTDTYAGTFPDLADGDISTPAGAIIIKRGAYGMVNELTARGDTKDAARQALESIDVTHFVGDPIHISSSAPDWSDKTSSYTLTVPGEWNDLSTSAAAGSIQLQAQAIDGWTVGQAAGGITAAGTTARDIRIAGAAGGIVFTDVMAIDMDIDLTAGAAILDMERPIGNGVWRIANTAGLIDLELGAGAYDVAATADVGRVALDMEGEDVEGPGCAQDYGSYACVGEHHRKRSHGFDAADVQTIIELRSTSGDVEVHQ